MRPPFMTDIEGINPLRINVFGLGEKNPIASNATLEGRNLNRRVEVELVEDNEM